MSEDTQHPPSTTAPPSPTGPVKRRTAKMRRELLARLPRLGYGGWSVGDQFVVDEELGNLVDLGADAVLAPLEALLEDRRERS